MAAHKLHTTVRQQRKAGQAIHLPEPESPPVALVPHSPPQAPRPQHQRPLEAAMFDFVSRCMCVSQVMVMGLFPLMFGQIVAFTMHGGEYMFGEAVLECFIPAPDIAALSGVRWVVTQILRGTRSEQALAPLPGQDAVEEVVRGVLHGLLGVLYACALAASVLTPFYLLFIGCGRGEHNSVTDMLYVLYTDWLRLRRWIIVDCAPACGHLLTMMVLAQVILRTVRSDQLHPVAWGLVTHCYACMAVMMAIRVGTALQAELGLPQRNSCTTAQLLLGWLHWSCCWLLPFLTATVALPPYCASYLCPLVPEGGLQLRASGWVLGHTFSIDSPHLLGVWAVCVWMTLRSLLAPTIALQQRCFAWGLWCLQLKPVTEASPPANSAKRVSTCERCVLALAMLPGLLALAVASTWLHWAPILVGRWVTAAMVALLGPDAASTDNDALHFPVGIAVAFLLRLLWKAFAVDTRPEEVAAPDAAALPARVWHTCKLALLACTWAVVTDALAGLLRLRVASALRYLLVQDGVRVCTPGAVLLIGSLTLVTFPLGMPKLAELVLGIRAPPPRTYTVPAALSAALQACIGPVTFRLLDFLLVQLLLSRGACLLWPNHLGSEGSNDCAAWGRRSVLWCLPMVCLTNWALRRVPEHHQRAHALLLQESRSVLSERLLNRED